MAPAGKGGEPKGDLLKAIDASFGSLEKLQAAFNEAAMKRFGSGWAWLVPGKEKPLAVVSSPNQDNPLMDGAAAPILGVDVWEHAYYLKYRNLRAKYLEAWWKVVNWDRVAMHFAASKK
jgi:Fe-Mn family superoxide dismutase